MFNLDIALFNFIYNICKEFGSFFTLGAGEGFMMLSGIFAATIMNTNKKAKR